MTGLRFWIAVLAAASFLAGAGAGLYAALGLQPDPESGHSFSDYERRFLSEFPLDPERRQILRSALRAYDEEREAVQRRYLSVYRSAMEDDLAALSREVSDLVRNHILPSDARERFDQLALGRSYTPLEPKR